MFVLLLSINFSSCLFKSIISTHSSLFTENSAVLRMKERLSASGNAVESNFFNSSE